MPALELVLFVPLVAANPGRMTPTEPLLPGRPLALVLLIGSRNLVVARRCWSHALRHRNARRAAPCCSPRCRCGLTNVIVFGLAFWELDRGGPVAAPRRRARSCPRRTSASPQDEDHDAIEEVAAGLVARASDWVPALVDYLYVSVTNSTAFSPTDTMPLSTRAKILMADQSWRWSPRLVIALGVGLLPH